MKNLVLTILTSISTFIIGGFITYIYEEFKHKKSDYRLKYTISKIDKIQEWGEYIESVFYQETLIVDKNMEENNKVLFSDARKNCIRIDQNFDRNFRERLDAINPLVVEVLKKKASTDITKLKNSILKMISTFLNDLEKLRFELYSHPFPKGVISTKKNMIKNLVIALLFTLLVVLITFTRSCSQRNNYHWVEKNRKKSYEEIECCIQTRGQQVGRNQTISSLFVNILSEEPYFFNSILNFRSKCVNSIVSQNDIISFQEELKKKNKVFMIVGLISKLKLIEFKFGKTRSERGRVPMQDCKVKMKQKINEALISLEELKGNPNLNQCYSKFSEDIENIFSKLFPSEKELKSTFGCKIDEYCIQSIKSLSDMEKKVSTIETNWALIIFKILAEMSDEKFISILKHSAMSKSLHESLRISIISKIGEMGNMEDLEFLVSLMKDESDIIKNISIFAITAILSKKDNNKWNEFLNGRITEVKTESNAGVVVNPNSDI